jgi:hypothetical protein
MEEKRASCRKYSRRSEMGSTVEQAEKVAVIASKSCSHYPLLEQELRTFDVRYELRFVEDQPELIERYGLYQSPNLVVDDQVEFRGEADHPLPSRPELKRILESASIL